MCIRDSSYDIPWYDYDLLENRPDLGMNFNLVAWGPNPAIDPASAYYEVAKIRINDAEKSASPIFWIFSDNSEQFDLLQNDEFIAVSNTAYYIGITFAGQTVSLPFMISAPYIEYIQNQ